MVKNVFRHGELKVVEDTVVLKLTHNYAPVVEEEVVEVVPEYTGPTADDLRREAELFKQQWEVEKQQLLAQAQAEAEQIIRNAENAAFEEIKRKTDQAAIIKTEAESQAQEIIKEAEAKAREIVAQGEVEKQKTVGNAYKEGYDKGSEDGYKEGQSEVNRLIERLHIINEKTLDKRQEILEQQIVELVLLIARKVVKVISETQRNVVMQNVLQSLRRVKGRGDVTIRVNLADVGLTSEHTKEFMDAVESIKSITVAEDSSVEKGGCIIETDFGAIDARISSQLNELEQKILEISPIKTVTKSIAN